MADNSLEKKYDKTLQEEQLFEHDDSLETDISNRNLSVNKDYIFQSKKKGLLFPSLVITSAFLISFLFIFISGKIISLDINNYYNKRTENDLNESVLMKKVKQDNDKLIMGKDKEISSIRKKLDNYNEQLRTLREIIFAKNRGDKISEDTISSEYSEMSISELEKAIGEIEDKKIKTEKELDKEINEKRKLIEDSDRNAVILSEENGQGLIDISDIQEKLERQKVINNQLYILQNKIFSDIKTDNFKRAEQRIENLKKIIYMESNNNLPGINRIRITNENTIGMIEKYISLQEELKKRNSGGSFDGFKCTLLFSNILSAIENNNLNEADLKIKQFKSAIDKETDISLGGTIGQKDQYMRTASVIEDYIYLNNEINKLNKSGEKPETGMQAENIVQKASDQFPDYTESDLLLYGKVAYTDNKSLSIETFFSLPVSPGDLFLVKNRKTQIAYGEIISLEGNSVKGIIEKLRKTEKYPEVNNLVYIVKN